MNPLAWLHARDPELLTVRRAVRVTLVACLGFYLCRYVIGNAGMAPYALFGAVALGALSQIPGSPAQRSRTLLAVLPVGWRLAGLTLAVLLLAGAGPALPQARLDGQLAEASYALYQSERHQPTMMDWQATLVAGHHAVRGAEALIRSCPSGGVLPGVESLTRGATDVAGRYEHVAVGLLTRDRAALREPMPQPPAVDWPTDLGQDLYHLADLRVWFESLREDLDRILGTPEPAPSADPAALRVRVARVADGASS